MKKNKFFWILQSLSLGIIIFLTACGDDSKSNSSNDEFYYRGNSCYNATRNEFVSSRYCERYGSSEFFEERNGRCYFRETGEEFDRDYCDRNPFRYSGNTCYDDISNQAVSDRFCQSNGRYYRDSFDRYNRDYYDNRFSNNFSSSCVGQHAFNNNGVTGYLDCGVNYDCRGLTLLDVRTNQIVTCR